MLRKEDISIIVVDDLQFSCEVVKSGLKKSGYVDIRTANSANQAMLLMNQQRADVVLADFWMPEMNGLELTDLIRRWDDSNNRYTGIILLTAEDTASSIVVAFDHGVDDFVSKSANQYELAARVYGAGRTAVMQNAIRKVNRELTTEFERSNHLSLIDSETGLSNEKQFNRALESMVVHCETRGGGLAVGMIRIDMEPSTDGSQESSAVRPGTLRAIANALKLVLRPMDEIARLNDNTFAIALLYADADKFSNEMFERSTKSILKHTHLLSDQGKRIRLSLSCWNTDQFDPVPTPAMIIGNTEMDLKPISLSA
jgi:PleD family two-component response regulator